MSEVFPRCCFCGRFISQKVNLEVYQLPTSEYGKIEVTVCDECAKEHELIDEDDE